MQIQTVFSNVSNGTRCVVLINKDLSFISCLYLDLLRVSSTKKQGI